MEIKYSLRYLKTSVLEKVNFLILSQTLGALLHSDMVEKQRMSALWMNDHIKVMKTGVAQPRSQALPLTHQWDMAHLSQDKKQNEKQQKEARDTIAIIKSPSSLQERSLASLHPEKQELTFPSWHLK